MIAIQDYLRGLVGSNNQVDLAQPAAELEAYSVSYSQTVNPKGSIINNVFVRRLNYLRTVLIPLLNSLN